MIYIAGVKKCSLLDYPDHLSAVIYLHGCPFRCPFCHNPSLVLPTNELPMPEDDVLAFLATRTELLDGVTITGGEPLQNPELPEFISKIKELGFRVKLDTNGFYPDRLHYVLHNNLVDYVAMDIKNSIVKYAQTIGIPSHHFDSAPITHSAGLIMAESCPYEFRTTVMREFHTPDDIESIGQWLLGAKKYAIQNFKKPEKMLSNQTFHSIEKPIVAQMKDVAARYFTTVTVRD